VLYVSARIVVGAEVVITHHHVTLDGAGVVTEDVLPRGEELQQPRYPHCPPGVGQPPNPAHRPAVQHSRFRWARRTCRRSTRG
jgi:hypothetical protein